MKFAMIFSAAVFALAAPTIALADDGEGDSGKAQASRYLVQIDDSKDGLGAELYLDGKLVQSWKGEKGSLGFGLDVPTAFSMDKGEQKFNIYKPGTGKSGDGEGRDGEGEDGGKSRGDLYATLDLKSGDGKRLDVSFRTNDDGKLAAYAGDDVKSYTETGDWQQAFHLYGDHESAYDIAYRDERDGGSHASAAPEPATWAMLLIGFVSFGFAGARKARALTPARAGA